MTDVHNFDRRRNDPNVEALALRVTALEHRMEQFDEGLRRNTIELKANTLLTEQIHGNTEDIVSAVEGLKGLWDFSTKWGKRVAVFSRYMSYVVGLAAAVAAWLHIKK